MKLVHKMNCWEWKHPIKSIKRAYWRITKGYCPRDVWDWYTYMAQLTHDTFMYLAANHMGTPYEFVDKDDKKDKYAEKLECIGRQIVRATDWEESYENPFRALYYKDLEKIDLKNGGADFSKTDKQLFEYYQKVQEKNYKQAVKDLKEAYGWILDNWFDMWD